MKGFETSAGYVLSDLSATAEARGVIGLVGGRAEIYCFKCAAEKQPRVIGEVFKSTVMFRDAGCDYCGCRIVDGCDPEREST